MSTAARAEQPVFDDQISSRNFARLSALIHQLAGIKIPQTKKTMLEGRLRRRVRAIGAYNLDAYCDALFDGAAGEEETEHLLNAVTTNKTDFFREPKHFEYMQSTILPAIGAAGTRRLRAWSAGCSTGAEPYTMAMVFDDYATRNGGPEYGILATDLDSGVLEIARRGIYPRAQVQPVPPAMRLRYVMEPLDPAAPDVRIVPALRSAVGFAQLNFMDASYPVGDPMDIIMCRNVLIYFDRPTQEAVLNRLCRKLKQGGWIMIGHSETIAEMDLPLRQVGNTTFQKV
ncbi:protein-glutamate O-methyltransferase CheR [Croceicoccus sp. YJ47]|uniref:CheR family methyltransferase n=1 Tax=Croceicoccus sp. YJ47 TaxID=2798724 RepID=UPI0019217DF4|nr:CheR family methyltransferase [Croceicoccus sp. YJ47]QQN74321.1 chemotaxis protein CheR [Croceicoccus sp. YJ47]